jgi:hypothetical protein
MGDFKSTLVPVSGLMREMGSSGLTHREWCAKHGVRTALCEPSRRGYSHFITHADADRIRAKHLQKIIDQTPPPEPVLPPAPPPPPPPPPVQQPLKLAPTLEDVIAHLSDLLVEAEESKRQRRAFAEQIGKWLTTTSMRLDSLAEELRKHPNGGAVMSAQFMTQSIAAVDKKVNSLLVALGEKA